MKLRKMEYTLQDAFDTLRDKKAQREKDIEDLTNKISNNQIFSLKPSELLENIRKKQDKLRRTLLKEVQQVEPENYPIPRTSDLREEVMTDLEKQIQNMQNLLGHLELELSQIQEDII